jgi:hypothetical protein
VSSEPTVREEIVSKLETESQTEPTAEGVPAPVPTAATGSASAVDLFGAPSAPSSPAPSSGTDRVFDPAIHCGMDKKNRDGTYRRKPGRKPQAEVAAANRAKVDYRGMADFLSTLLFNSTQSALGKEWEPSQSEREQINKYAALYMESQGYDDIPPGIALCLAVGMYAVPRFAMPETKARLRSFGENVGLVKRKPRAIAAPPAPAPEPAPLPERASEFPRGGPPVSGFENIPRGPAGMAAVRNG